MKNCPVCGAPVADDVPECFKCGSDLSSKSKSTPSLMARFKQEADLQIVEELDEDELEAKDGIPDPRGSKAPPRGGKRGPKGKGKGSPKKGKPARPARKTATTKPPLVPRAGAGKAPDEPEPAVPSELSSLMGSPKQELAQASRIYAELLARGGMGSETMERLEKVMGEMGADTEKLKAQFAQAEPRGGADPANPAPTVKSKPKAPAKTPAKAKAKAKPKSKAKAKGKGKTKADTTAKDTALVELPAKPTEGPKGKGKGKGKSKAKGKGNGAGKAKASSRTAPKTIKGEGDDVGSEELATSHCPLCAKEAEPDWTHCPWCGGELPPHCPTCQREMAPDWRFCPYCGFDERDDRA